MAHVATTCSRLVRIPIVSRDPGLLPVKPRGRTATPRHEGPYCSAQCSSRAHWVLCLGRAWKVFRVAVPCFVFPASLSHVFYFSLAQVRISIARRGRRFFVCAFESACRALLLDVSLSLVRFVLRGRWAPTVARKPRVLDDFKCFEAGHGRLPLASRPLPWQCVRVLHLGAIARPSEPCFLVHVRLLSKILIICY